MCKLLLDNISFQVWTNCVLLLIVYFTYPNYNIIFYNVGYKKLLKGFVSFILIYF